MLFNQSSLECEGLCVVILALGVKQRGDELRGIGALCISDIASSSDARSKALADPLKLSIVLPFTHHYFTSPRALDDAKTRLIDLFRLSTHECLPT